MTNSCSVLGDTLPYRHFIICFMKKKLNSFLHERHEYFCVVSRHQSIEFGRTVSTVYVEFFVGYAESRTKKVIIVEQWPDDKTQQKVVVNLRN